MYELERRAIFTQKWILTTHSLRFPNVGDWIKFDTAGYEYVITRDRKGEIHAFHNVCRHRAYPVVEKPSGHNQILSCKYHGWTYSLDGKLTKAPWYDDVQNFDKNQNGLFKIHVHIDNLGFIWVNLNASDQPEPWSDEFDNIDKLERYDVYNLDDYAFDHEWEMDAETNWKLCCDNFNECYHCPTSHPTVSTLVDVETLTADSMKGYIVHNGAQSEEQKENDMKVCTTFYFPNASTNLL
jgi:phenylpropionate dioxygenase-like ring-hydroxylating dioxygenase large terminal subunit